MYFGILRCIANFKVSTGHVVKPPERKNFVEENMKDAPVYPSDYVNLDPLVYKYGEDIKQQKLQNGEDLIPVDPVTSKVSRIRSKLKRRPEIAENIPLLNRKDLLERKVGEEPLDIAGMEREIYEKHQKEYSEDKKRHYNAQKQFLEIFEPIPNLPFEKPRRLRDVVKVAKNFYQLYLKDGFSNTSESVGFYLGVVAKHRMTKDAIDIFFKVYPHYSLKPNSSSYMHMIDLFLHNRDYRMIAYLRRYHLENNGAIPKNMALSFINAVSLCKQVDLGIQWYKDLLETGEIVTYANVKKLYEESFAAERMDIVDELRKSLFYDDDIAAKTKNLGLVTKIRSEKINKLHRKVYGEIRKDGERMRSNGIDPTPRSEEYLVDSKTKWALKKKLKTKGWK
jgi:hypothetical protein